MFVPVVAANVFLGFFQEEPAAAPHSGYWAIGSFFWAALYIAFFIRIIRAPLPRKEKWKFARYIILPNLVFLLSGLPENIAPVRIPEAVSMSGIITQRTVKDIIGHTNAALTIRQYVHSDMDTKPAGLKAIENIV